MKQHPQKLILYEINTAVWLQELSQKSGHRVTLCNVPDDEWDRLKKAGFHFIWLMGVWKRSPMGTQIALKNTSLVKEFHQVLEDFIPEDVIGSPYCVQEYQGDDLFGGNEGILKARNALHERGMRLVLDFVPNHTAPDHPWIKQHPEFFIQGTEEQLKKFPESYIRIGDHIFARGKDPNFPAWQDVVQLNAFHPGLRNATIQTIREIGFLCDGLRVDMAMLMFNSVFQQTWSQHKINPPGKDFWEEVLPSVKHTHPHLFFMAEAYWDTEPKLLEQGFDACYDKRLYDFLRERAPKQIKKHLSQSFEYQSRLVHFIENHDEQRAVTAFPANQWKVAALTAATVPGIFMLHMGQLEGQSRRIPVFLRRKPEEFLSPDVTEFYNRLISLLSRPEFNGTFEILSSSHPALCGWQWINNGKSLTIWVNPTRRNAHFSHEIISASQPIWSEGISIYKHTWNEYLFHPFGFAIWESH